MLLLKRLFNFKGIEWQDGTFKKILESLLHSLKTVETKKYVLILLPCDENTVKMKNVKQQWYTCTAIKEKWKKIM